MAIQWECIGNSVWHTVCTQNISRALQNHSDFFTRQNGLHRYVLEYQSYVRTRIANNHTLLWDTYIPP